MSSFNGGDIWYMVKGVDASLGSFGKPWLDP